VISFFNKIGTIYRYYIILIGTIRTNANWIREYVKNHPDYDHDSIVKNSIVFDMMKEINQIAHGKTDVVFTSLSFHYSS
jgi:hypothetical protein